MRVLVAYADASREALVAVEVGSAATVMDAVAASGLVTRLALTHPLSFAIFGQRVQATTPLAEGDRVEVLRPLVADPKAARRQRAQENPLPAPRPKPRRCRK